MKKIITCMIVLSVLMSSVAFANTVGFGFNLKPSDMNNDFERGAYGFKNDNEARFYVTQEYTTYPMSSSTPIYYRPYHNRYYSIDEIANYIVMTSNARKYASYKVDVKADDEFYLACRVKYSALDSEEYLATGKWTP